MMANVAPPKIELSNRQRATRDFDRNVVRENMLVFVTSSFFLVNVKHEEITSFRSERKKNVNHQSYLLLMATWLRSLRG